MLEKAKLGRTLEKADYKAQLPQLRAELLTVQRQLQESRHAVIIILEGVDNASEAEVANKLNEWLDTRGLEFFAFGPKTDEELQRPPLLALLAKFAGTWANRHFVGFWYTGTLMEQALDRKTPETVHQHLQRIAFFESMLARDNVIILKFWLHKSRSQQKKFLDDLDKKQHKRWGVTETDYQLLKAHDKLISAAELTIRTTDSAEAPWMIVEAADARYCNMTVAGSILKALKNRLANPNRPHDLAGQTGMTILSDRSILSTLDMHARLPDDDEKSLKHYQNKLMALSWEAFHKKRSLVVVFEGWDAAGKGGAIRRIIRAVDARMCRVIQIAAPTDEEKAHHYLWRFWRHIPLAGHATIYDRSWYGRVLVERVEGFAKDHEWRQAYLEINEFEQQLIDHGVILAKFWLHITPEEQLKRFQEREATPYKQHKITDEDWRNREKWGDYEQAVQDMVVRTSTQEAPWELVPANDKPYARVEVLKRLCERLENGLKG